MAKTKKMMHPEYHGTFNGYSNYGCRCDLCKLAGRETNKIQKAKRIARPKDGTEWYHGTVNGYRNWGCRCEPCHEAFKIDQRKVAARNRKRQGFLTREEKRQVQLDIQNKVTLSDSHGTELGIQMGCKCKLCTNKKASMKKIVRLNTPKTGLEPWHGTQVGYQSWGCRCERCYKANSHYRKIQYANGGNGAHKYRHKDK